ncbi:imidazole glycerol phosphate synthase subunit HisF [Psychrobium sp. 1_MG-2023]|uniref:imidazole glycerol phosphate synthase subunit HisF n=1 Tax=Psychrobium sp. 1_MG-2023 TaxID=3062624 RepID=UPI000C31C31E|nr:imidazole glycerol phosphate synthase cyclase subunit [Psychrobium sp. 1_MG-2023]MDP2559855.1 imidazole glycerol phosphate synthase cyclase subunit [Psychrobium sp. 1_MG-2023]PKF59043.1 imidazole glycerol phosphate synthase subunit HisF [Alteromonadales bacterium alter-6D02]
MRNIRIIARLDIKSPNLVKGIQLEGLRKLGDPNDFARQYYLQGIDEIIYEDIVASLYERNSILELISKTSDDIFVPITVGGGLRTIEDVTAALRAGADKVSINTAALKSPQLISDVANKFGSQCMVLAIQAKRIDNGWEAYHDNGREKTGIDVIAWAKQGQELGAGEILLTSVDKEGTKKGFDIELIKAVSEAVSIPVIAHGGMGCLDDCSDAVIDGGADSIALSNLLHYEKVTVDEIREHCNNKNIPVRSKSLRGAS